MGIKICPDCEGKVSESLDACPHCGHEFKEEISCPDCGEMVAADSASCPVCGHKFISKSAQYQIVNNVEAPKAKVIDIACPNCSSKDFFKGEDGRYKCHSCGSSFKLDESGVTIINNVINNAPNKDAVKCNEINILECDVTEDEARAQFLRFLEDYKASSPNDVFDCEIGEFKKISIDISLIAGNVIGTYQRMTGHKEGTVIQWQPDNGVFSGGSSAIQTLNYGDDFGYIRSMFEVMRYNDLIDFSKVCGKEKFTLEEKYIEAAERTITKSVYNNKKPLALEIHYKGEHYSASSVDLLSIDAYRVPCYEFEVTYKDQKCTYIACASGNAKVVRVKGSGFKNSEETAEKLDISNYLLNNAKKSKTKELLFLLLAFMALFAVPSQCVAILNLAPYWILRIIDILAFVLLIIQCTLFHKKSNAYKKDYDTFIKASDLLKKNEQIIGFKNKMDSYGYELTAEELEEFDNVSKLNPKSVIDEIKAKYNLGQASSTSSASVPAVGVAVENTNLEQSSDCDVQADAVVVGAGVEQISQSVGDASANNEKKKMSFNDIKNKTMNVSTMLFIVGIIFAIASNIALLLPFFTVSSGTTNPPYDYKDSTVFSAISTIFGTKGRSTTTGFVGYYIDSVYVEDFENYFNDGHNVFGMSFKIKAIFAFVFVNISVVLGLVTLFVNKIKDNIKLYVKIALPVLLIVSAILYIITYSKASGYYRYNYWLDNDSGWWHWYKDYANKTFLVTPVLLFIAVVPMILSIVMDKVSALSKINKKINMLSVYVGLVISGIFMIVFFIVTYKKNSEPINPTPIFYTYLVVMIIYLIAAVVWNILLKAKGNKATNE